ncbi:MAG: hypothetical protein ACUVT4_00080 [Actinomycetota bacterium]
MKVKTVTAEKEGALVDVIAMQVTVFRIERAEGYQGESRQTWVPTES